MRLLSTPAFGAKIVLEIAMLLLAPSCFLVGQTNNVGCSAEHYKVIALPLLPARINELGQIAGTTTAHRAALWTEQSGLRELPLPAGFENSEGVAVNNSGHLTGVLYDRNFGKHRAFVFANGVLTLLSGGQSRAYDINDSDDVVGESLLPGSKTTAPVSWHKNTMRSLGGCCGGSAKGINKNSDVIGDVYDETGRYQAFLWNSNQGVQAIGPSDRYSSAIAVNDHRHVVVQVFSEAFLYTTGTLTRLELSPLYPSQPRAMNSCDSIVGSFGPFADAERAFVWERSRGFIELNSRIASDSGWVLESATSINDQGEIVGRLGYKGQDDTGFLLVPEH